MKQRKPPRQKPRTVPLALSDEEELVMAQAMRPVCSVCGGPIAWDGLSGAMFAAPAPDQRRAFIEALEEGFGPTWASWWCLRPGCDGLGIFTPSSRIAY